MINKTQEEIMLNWGVDNSESPLVSVRCITYNHEPYIAQALDGFLMQKTTFPFEVIVHDDASTDNTAGIIKEYAKKFPNIIKPIYENENQYSKHDGSIRRIMDSHCKGKYFALCEGDDYWINENKLQIQVDFLEKNLKYSMVFHNAIQHYEDGTKPDDQFSDVKDKDYIGKELLRKWIVPTASVVYRKECVETEFYKQLSSEKRFIYGDIILFLNLCKEGKCRGMSSTMSVYRRQETGAVFGYSSSRNYKHHFHLIALRDYFSSIRSYINYLIVKDDATWCAQALLAADYKYAKLFFCFRPFINIFLVPLYYIRLYKYKEDYRSK